MNEDASSSRPPRGARLLSSVVLATSILAGSFGCSSDPKKETPAAPVVLGLEMVTRGAPGLDPNFSEAYETLRNGQFAFSQFSFEWRDLENYAGSRGFQLVDLHRAQAARQGVGLSIEVLLIDHRLRGRLPLDLDDENFTSWDDPRIVNRLVGFLREMAVETRSVPLVSVWLGRNVDAYFAQNRPELRSYRRLLAACRDSLRRNMPGTALGAMICYEEAKAAGVLDVGDSLAAGAGVLGLSVYGRDPDYAQQLGPAATAARVAEALGRYPGFPLYLCETGYPTLARPGEGQADPEAEQRDFAAALTGILSDPPSNLKAACWFCLNDWHVDKARPLAERLFAGEPDRLAAYMLQLETLGLHRINGVPKPVWSYLRDWNRATRAVVAQENGRSQGAVLLPSRPE